MPYDYCHYCDAYVDRRDLMEKRQALGRTVLVCRDDRACENREREQRGQPPRFR